MMNTQSRKIGAFVLSAALATVVALSLWALLDRGNPSAPGVPPDRDGSAAGQPTETARSSRPGLANERSSATEDDLVKVQFLDDRSGMPITELALFDEHLAQTRYTDLSGWMRLARARRYRGEAHLYGEFRIWLHPRFADSTLRLRPHYSVQLDVVGDTPPEQKLAVELSFEGAEEPGVQQLDAYTVKTICGERHHLRLPAGIWNTIAPAGFTVTPRSFDVGSGQSVELTLSRNEELRGIIRDSLGTPCPGVEVHESFGANARARTDSNGTFRLASKSTAVFLDVDDGHERYESVLAAGPFSRSDAVEIVLRPKKQNSLVIKSDLGHAEDVQVELKRSSAREPFKPLDIEAGRWALAGPLREGDTVLVRLGDRVRFFERRWRVHESAHERVYEIDVALTDLKGRVLDLRGRPIGNASLQLVQGAPDENVAKRFQQLARSGVKMGTTFFAGSTESGPDGVFVLEGVGSGEALLVASAPGFVTHVEQIAPRAERVELFLGPTSELHGRLLHSTESAALTWQVFAKSTEGRTYPGRIKGTEYRIENLKPGAFDVCLACKVSARRFLPVRNILVAFGRGETNRQDIDVANVRLTEVRFDASDADVRRFTNSQIRVTHTESGWFLRISNLESNVQLPAGRYHLLAKTGFGTNELVFGFPFQVAGASSRTTIPVPAARPDGTRLRALVDGMPAAHAWLRFPTGRVVHCDENGVCALPDTLPVGYRVERVHYRAGAWGAISCPPGRLRAAASAEHDHHMLVEWDE